MICVEVFKHREAASERAKILKDHGIDARVWVDPMESLYPALSAFQDVALMVRDDQVAAAERLLRPAMRKAG